MAISTKEFIATLINSGIMTAEEIDEVQRALPSEEQGLDLMSLARELVKRRKLTKYQAGRIYQGKAKGLVLGNYVLLDKIGEGGMGEVFKAEHRRMRRIVAIKTLPAAMTESDKAVKRFQREVEAAARLVHPNIVAAFDADEAEGTHYLVMEFVDGQNLAAIVTKNGPLSVEKAISCVIQAARGLSFAHSQGLIHRDIKPHNLLMDKSGVVKILDMGLVRFDPAGEAADSVARTKLTFQDQIVGTVDYMSPEQADDTSNVDQRTDIYSLGCTLYRLLTGRPPYGGESTIQKLMAHREYAVPPLSAARDDIPQTLERVYQKMVAKDREDRYASMDEVIAALEGGPVDDALDLNKSVITARGGERMPEFSGTGATAVVSPTTVAHAPKLDKEVTLRDKEERDTKRDEKKPAARPTPPAKPAPTPTSKPSPSLPRSRKSNSIPPLVMGGAGAAVLVFAALAAAIIWWFNRPPVLVINWPVEERKEGRLELDGRRKKLPAEGDQLIFQMTAGKHKLHAVRRGFAHIDEEFHLSPGERLELPLDWVPTTSTSLQIAPSEVSTVGPSREEVEKVLRPAWLTMQSERTDERARLATRQRQQLERLASQKSDLDSLAASGISPYELKRAGNGDPAGAPRELVAVLGDSRLRHPSHVHHVAFDRESRLLASASQDAAVRIWDALTGEEKLVLRGHGTDVRCVAFSPTENLLASGSFDGTIRLWNSTTGAERPPLRRTAEMRVTALAFSPNGKILASSAEDKLVRLWEVATGQELEPFKGHEAKVMGVAFSDDGKLVASCGEDGSVKVWNPATREESAKLAGHARPARCVAFLPKSHQVASGSEDGTAVLWDADSGAEAKKFDWHGLQVFALAFSADGQTLATGSGHGRIRLWDIAKGDRRLDHDKPAYGLAFSPDGNFLAFCGSPPQAVSLFHLDSAKERLVRTGHAGLVSCAAFSADGKTLVSGGHDYSLRLWNLGAASEDKSLLGHSNLVSGVAFHPSGNSVFSGGFDLTLREWSVATGKERQLLTRTGDLTEYVSALALSPDAKTLACASADRSIKLWDLESGSIRATLWGHSEHSSWLAFSPDGGLLASAGHDKTIRLFDVAKKKHALILYGHEDKVLTLAFSPDGALLASGGQDSQLKLWDLVKLGEPTTLLGHGSPVLSLDFSPDGKTIVSSGFVPPEQPADIRLWNVAEKKVTRRIATSVGPIHRVVFSPEGRHVATANSDGTLHILRVGEAK